MGRKSFSENQSKSEEKLSVLPDQSPIYTYTHTMRSRYGETDKMGYVYYARYLEYFEVARTEMIRSLGMPYRKIEENGVMLPVVESHVKYKAPIFYDDKISVKVHMFGIPTVKLETYYEMFVAGAEELRAVGKVTLCFVDEATRRPCRAPDSFIQHLQAAMEA